MPIFKNKDELDITNYRPISLLPVISKVYEKVFYNRLYNYFFVNNLLSSSQFGFRSGASTEHAPLKFSDDILKLFDQNKVVVATFMDLSKAFDCVDHNILLSKLKRYGIHETALQWSNSSIAPGLGFKSRARFLLLEQKPVLYHEWSGMVETHALYRLSG